MLETRVAEVVQRHEGTFVKEFDLEFWALTYAILSQYYYLLRFMHFLGVLGTTVLPTSITLWKINPQYMDKPKFTAGTLERVLSDIDLNGESLPTKASEKMSRESNKPKTGYTRGIKTRPYHSPLQNILWPNYLLILLLSVYLLCEIGLFGLSLIINLVISNAMVGGKLVQYCIDALLWTRYVLHCC